MTLGFDPKNEHQRYGFGGIYAPAEKPSAMQKATALVSAALVKVGLKKPPPPPPPTHPHDRFDLFIAEAERANSVPFFLTKAVIEAESNFDQNAMSNVGALGLMQLMPGTAEMMGVENALDPRANILGGTKYLRSIYNQFKREDGVDRWQFSLAAYNAGIGYVLDAQRIAGNAKLPTDQWWAIASAFPRAKWGGKRPDWQQTLAYVEKIVESWTRRVIKHSTSGAAGKLEEVSP